LLGWQELPSAQAPQAPLLQTLPLPQSVPLETGLQGPVEHELHVPQAVLQQIPETQCPFWHWVSAEHAVPSAILVLQDPDAQKLPATQSPSVVQPVLHADNEAHATPLGQAVLVGVQTCELSHALLVKVDPVHESAAQAVLTAV
jgi:hypothetical protein